MVKVDQDGKGVVEADSCQCIVPGKTCVAKASGPVVSAVAVLAVVGRTGRDAVGLIQFSCRMHAGPCRAVLCHVVPAQHLGVWG